MWESTADWCFTEVSSKLELHIDPVQDVLSRFLNGSCTVYCWRKHFVEGLFPFQHSFRRAGESFLARSGRGGVAALWMFSSTKEQISTNRTPVTSDSPQTLKSKSFPQVQPHAGLQSSIFKAPKSSAICSSDEREKDEKVEWHSAALRRHPTNYSPFWLLMAGELAAHSGIIVLMCRAARPFLTQNRATLICVIAFHHASALEASGSASNRLKSHSFTVWDLRRRPVQKTRPEIQCIVFLLRSAVSVCSLMTNRYHCVFLVLL